MSVRLQAHVLTFLIAPIIQSHEVWDLWQEWEVGTIEGPPRTEAVVRVDTMFLERMRRIHIGSCLVYSAVGAVPNISIDYTATGDSYSTFRDCPLPI
jgi:hypothetical protein